MPILMQMFLLKIKNNSTNKNNNNNNSNSNNKQSNNNYNDKNNNKLGLTIKKVVKGQKQGRNMKSEE